MRICFVNEFNYWYFFHFLNRGKPEADAGDRSFGEKRYDPIQATPPPPPLPSQYTQAPQPISSSSVHLHAKGAHGEGRELRGHWCHCVTVIAVVNFSSWNVEALSGFYVKTTYLKLLG